jgi:hypothetical protein
MKIHKGFQIRPRGRCWFVEYYFHVGDRVHQGVVAMVRTLAEARAVAEVCARIDLQDLAHELDCSSWPDFAVYDAAVDAQVPLLPFMLTHPEARLSSAETGDGLFVVDPV